jgi:hypothetical protein
MVSDTTSSGFPTAGSPGFTIISFHHFKLSFATLAELLSPHVGLILSILIILAVRYARSPWRKVPPGPKGLPALGNVLQLIDKRWLHNKDCKENFGMSNSGAANTLTPQIYESDFRAYNVFACPWQTNYRFK